MERCPWCLGTEIETRYHDQEWGTPVHDERTHFEYIILDAFQAGLSWRTILNKRENFRRAFAEFDPAVVAGFGEMELERLMQDARIVRNKAKILAASLNAQAFLRIQDEFGSFDGFIWRFTDGKTLHPRRFEPRDVPAKSPEAEAMSKELVRRGMKFVGPTICYAYMQAAGMVNDHLVSCFRHKELGGTA